MLDFYAIALKNNFHSKLKYGQPVYDFDEGIMPFMAPGQKIGIEYNPDEPIEHSGWLLIFHEEPGRSNNIVTIVCHWASSSTFVIFPCTSPRRHFVSVRCDQAVTLSSAPKRKDNGRA